MRALDERAGDDRAVLQHVLQVHQVAVVDVLGKVVGVMEVDDALLVSLHHVLGQQHAARQVLGDLAGHVIALHGVHGGVLVGVLLHDLLVVALNERQDLVVGGVARTLDVLHVAVGDVVAGDLEGLGGHDLVLHHVLHLFDRHRVTAGGAGVLHLVGDAAHHEGGKPVVLVNDGVGLGDGVDNLSYVERLLRAVALQNLHGSAPTFHCRN